MKTGMLIVWGILFVITILISGCSKSEDKKADAPSKIMQTIEQKATTAKEKTGAMTKEVVEKVEVTVESAGQKTATMTEKAVESAKEMGQQAMESVSEKMPEEAKQAVDTVKQYSGSQMEQAAGEGDIKVPEVGTEAMPGDASGSVEQTLKEKAAGQGMKLPSKY